MSKLHEIEQAILTRIEESECRPDTMISPGQKAQDRGDEYIQVFFLGTTTRQQFVTNEEAQTMLVQIDIGVGNVACQSELNEYTDEIYNLFPAHSKIMSDADNDEDKIHLATVNSYPTQNTIGNSDESKYFRRVLTVSIRYFV